MSTQFVTLRLAENLCGISVQRVQEVLPARTSTPVPLADADIAGLVNLRGQVVLSVDLRARLGLAPIDEGIEQMMVVVRVGDEPVSLVVDQIGDVADVTEDQFERPPQTLRTELREVITGSYKLPDQLLLALDVEAATTA